MGEMDWEKERKRLADVYSSMEDAELQAIARDTGSLTDAARKALQSELSRRGLPALPAKTESESKDEHREPPRAPVMIRRYRDLPEASIAKSILESAGIDSCFVDDNVVRLDWFYSNLEHLHK